MLLELKMCVFPLLRSLSLSAHDFVSYLPKHKTEAIMGTLSSYHQVYQATSICIHIPCLLFFFKQRMNFIKKTKNKNDKNFLWPPIALQLLLLCSAPVSSETPQQSHPQYNCHHFFSSILPWTDSNHILVSITLLTPKTTSTLLNPVVNSSSSSYLTSH